MSACTVNWNDSAGTGITSLRAGTRAVCATIGWGGVGAGAGLGAATTADGTAAPSAPPAIDRASRNRTAAITIGTGERAVVTGAGFASTAVTASHRTCGICRAGCTMGNRTAWCAGAAGCASNRTAGIGVAARQSAIITGAGFADATIAEGHRGRLIRRAGCTMGNRAAWRAGAV